MNIFSSQRLSRLAICTALGLASFIPSAFAGAPGQAVAPESIKITKPHQGVNAKRMYIRLDKATIVDLPSDARDVLVANPEIVDAVVRTAKQTYLLGKKIGQTNIFFFDAAGNQMLDLEVCVERDVAPLISSIKRFMPGSNVTVTPVKDNIILSGTVRNAVMSDKARDLAGRFVENPDQVVNMLGIEGGEQVMLKVRVVEMQRNLAKQLGVDLNAAAAIGDTTFNVLSQNPFSLLGDTLSNSTYSSTYTDPSNGDFAQGVLRALERVGMVRTLAEPTLTSVSGESANFLAGGEFPVPIGRDRDGNITIEFKPFGVGLGFTPVVLSEGRISLKISTEVSETSNDDALVANGTTVIDGNGNPITFGGLTIPSLVVRRTETTIELPSGGSMVIAGLLSDTTKQNLDGIPGIKDMPVLGALARSRDFRNEQTELVILVTAYLVGPVNEKELATPADKWAPPSDADAILLGRLNARYSKRGQVLERRSLQGPLGFIVQ